MSTVNFVFRDLHSLDLSLDIYHWKAGNKNSDLYSGEARYIQGVPEGMDKNSAECSLR